LPPVGLASDYGEGCVAVIELLVLAGLVALVLLAVVAGLFVLRQRRQGTVRAVLMPRHEEDDSASSRA
jgi:uncharacterized iron-regulated membrane protein